MVGGGYKMIIFSPALVKTEVPKYKQNNTMVCNVLTIGKPQNCVLICSYKTDSFMRTTHGLLCRELIKAAHN